MRPRAMVVTLTVAEPLPEANMLGVTVHVVVAVAAIGREQDRLTCDAKPFCGVTEIALVNVAVWPAFTVCVVVPVAVTEKSGGGGGGGTGKVTGLGIPSRGRGPT